MFLYINKALGRLGKEQKEKPIIFTTWAVAESFNPYPAKRYRPVKQETEGGIEM